MDKTAFVVMGAVWGVVQLLFVVQMVRDDKLRTEAGDVYVCGDCYVSTPVPRDE